jgi:thymidylate synthase (FAD)
MSYTYESLDEPTSQDVRDVINIHNHMSYGMYEDLMKAGVAKEQARAVLPPTIYTEFWITVNAHSLMNFLRLRNDEHAQWETRQYAKAMEEIFAEQMPVTYRAFKRFTWHVIAEEEDLPV